ncbi:hypothetical protein [Pseudonocardia zijingensis]|jgi:hypothetical protein|uniref:DivIVA domain-containing protein n=1 Tax=Pseudonocardia zijingensis TaxID=153376 RepID=A0ABP4AM57_9PSEU
MLYRTDSLDPVDTVASVLPGYRFHCPDVASVDRHIAERLEHMGPRSNLMPKFREAARQDIDRLLERRLYLMTVELTDPPEDEGYVPAQAA